MDARRRTLNVSRGIDLALNRGASRAQCCALLSVILLPIIAGVERERRSIALCESRSRSEWPWSERWRRSDAPAFAPGVRCAKTVSHHDRKDGRMAPSACSRNVRRFVLTRPIESTPLSSSLFFDDVCLVV